MIKNEVKNKQDDKPNLKLEYKKRAMSQMS